jgi:hypothetical protein
VNGKRKKSVFLKKIAQVLQIFFYCAGWWFIGTTSFKEKKILTPS